MYSNHKQTIKPPKATTVTKPLKTAGPSLSNKVPIELQQLSLDIFSNTFAHRFHSDLPAIVQQIKQHLFNRDFESAFGQHSYLETYAMRWSPSRVLAYTQIFAETLSKYHLQPQNLDQDSQYSQELPPVASRVQFAFASRVVCIGGGAGAELVALAACLQLIGRPCANLDESGDKPCRPPPSLSVQAIDIAEWSTVLKELHSCMTAAPPISEYSSSTVKAANAPLISPAACTLSFMREDVLNMKNEEIANVFTDAILVTLMFTLNELYSTSISLTTNLLLSLTLSLAPGALLLVVDSPGSYSTVSIGKTSKTDDGGTRRKYPMQWLLDHTLLESAAIRTGESASAEPRWERLESRESEWFRLSNELRYPINLEDMRYQLHLYRRL